MFGFDMELYGERTIHTFNVNGDFVRRVELDDGTVSWEHRPDLKVGGEWYDVDDGADINSHDELNSRELEASFQMGHFSRKS